MTETPSPAGVPRINPIAPFKIATPDWNAVGNDVIPPANELPPGTLRILALGDSITNGGGELQWGVAMKSWAEWVARGLGLPFTGLATGNTDDVLQQSADTQGKALSDQSFDRYAELEDPFGHSWSVAGRTRDLNPAEIQES